MTELQKAMRVLVEALKNDEGYRQGWKANIAMAYIDCEAEYDGSETHHFVANEAADNFLNLLCRDVNDE